MDLHAGSNVGFYRILSPIGAGGMGKVYAAEDSRLHRKVALKILSEESTQQPDRVQRFEQEAYAASALNHPNILTIYEVGRFEGVHYMATELIEGKTLRELLPTRLSLRKVLDVAVQAAGALAAAHAAGIVHRDIKPENIMVRPDGYVKILDFGLAKLTEPQFGPGQVDGEMETAITAPTEPGRIMGTWLYMSPEQVRGKEVDARTDIWSLGVVLYEMLSGHPPFAAATPTDTIVAIVDRDPQPLAQFGVTVPDELFRILSKALAKDCEERYQSIKDMALDLKQLNQALELQTVTRSTGIHSVIGRMPLVAQPKPAPRNRTAVLGLALVLLAGIAWGVWAVLHRQPPPAVPRERELTYSLLVQKMRTGQPYQDPFASTGQESFGSGWKFRFNFSSPQPGSLYLLDDAQGSGGKRVLALVYPLPPAAGSGPSGNRLSYLSANQRLQTGWYFFDQHPGTETVWMVWSVQPLESLEEVARSVAARQDPTITDPSESANIRGLLARYSSPKPVAATDQARKQTTIRGSTDVIVNAVELEHH
jgi:serine/threonine protein kinase